MFDLRYHVASLAAVFIALVIGILVGVGVSSQGVIDTSERNFLHRQIADLQQRLDASQQRSSSRAAAQRNLETFVTRTYPALMADRLRGSRVAVVFVGPVDGRLRSFVEETLDDGGSGGMIRLRALKVPIDPAGLNRILVSTRGLRRFAGSRRLADLGAALAAEFSAGGKTPLWNALADDLLEERAGGATQAADAIVVVRSARPQQRGTARFLRGFYSGLGSSGEPVVGVESTGSEGSAVRAYRARDLSSVDDVDTPSGRLALAVLLAGGQPGHYGVKESADDLLPPVGAPGPPPRAQ